MEIDDLTNLLGINVVDSCIVMLSYNTLNDDEIEELVASRFGEPVFDRHFSFENNSY
jgi:hypothetical protein